MTKAISEFNRESILLIFGCIIGMILGVPIFLIYGFGVFIEPLSETLNEGRGPVSMALNIGIMGNLIAAPLVGKLSDKYGASKMVLVGVVCLSITLFLYSFVQSLTQLYLISLAMVLLAAGTGPMTYSKIVAAWFNKQRGFALGLVLSGMGIGAIIMPILSQYLIDTVGWRTAYQYLGGTVLGGSFIPLYLILKDTPPQSENLPQDTEKDDNHLKEGVDTKVALSSGTYWLIAFGFLFVALGNSGGLVHLKPMLVDAGLTDERAAFYAGGMGFGVLIGRAMAGYLLDIFHAPKVAIAFLAGPFLAYAFFLTDFNAELAIIPIILFGIGMGGEFDVTPYLLSRYFGLKNFSVLFGFQIVTFSLGTGFGPTIMGYGYDTYGTYDMTIMFAMGSLLFGCLLLSRLGEYKFTVNKH